MDQDLKATLSRIAEALDRLAPPAPPSADIAAAEAYVWHAAGHRLEAVPKVNRVDLDLLMGVDRQKETLLDNTRRFAKGLPANNALLWGSRGSGKSSIVKAVHAHVNREMGGPPGPLALIEIHREDIPSLPALLVDDPHLAAPLRGVLRRPLLRRPGRRLQVAEGGARRRHRGPAGQRGVLRHLQPPPPDAARHDRERALDGDQSVGGGRGEGLAVATASACGLVSTMPTRTPSSP